MTEAQKKYKQLSKQILPNLKELLGFGVGDIVYYWEGWGGKVMEWDIPREGIVSKISFSTAGVSVTVRGTFTKPMLLGNKCFLTKEDCQTRINELRSV